MSPYFNSLHNINCSLLIVYIIYLFFRAGLFSACMSSMDKSRHNKIRPWSSAHTYQILKHFLAPSTFLSHDEIIMAMFVTQKFFKQLSFDLFNVTLHPENISHFSTQISLNKTSK